MAKDTKEKVIISSTPSQIETGSTHSSLGVVIGVLIVILVLILGGLYIWGSTLTQEDIRETTEPPVRINREPETPRNDADIQILNTVSDSDEVTAIEADLESTNLDTLESELTTIEAELNQ